jgi:soluble lytic murein transglycosylase
VAIEDVSKIQLVPLELVQAVIRQESDCDPSARSRVGTLGLMQVMPATAEQLKVDPKALVKPAPNSLAGVRLLAVLLKHYQGDLVNVLGAYNN